MSEIPGDLKFLKSHEWARVEGDGKVTIGISDHAQGLLGDLVYVELPGVGDRVEAGNASAVVESVKAASDVYSPVSGTVVEVNAALADKPETINEDAYGDGWLFVVEADEPDQLNELLDPDAYAARLVYHQPSRPQVRAPPGSAALPAPPHPELGPPLQVPGIDRPPCAAGFFFAQIGAIGLLRRAIERSAPGCFKGAIGGVRAAVADARAARRARRAQLPRRAARRGQTA
jgi:glycine cleavage system H protein